MPDTARPARARPREPSPPASMRAPDPTGLDLARSIADSVAPSTVAGAGGPPDRPIDPVRSGAP